MAWNILGAPPTPTPRVCMPISAPLRVLESFGRPRPTTNPYIVMLGRALAETDGVELSTFSWKQALLGRVDVFHLHWPEVLLRGPSPLKNHFRRALTLLAVVRMRLTGTAFVRTVHNLELPTGITRTERGILRLIERWTDLRIILNPTTPVPAGSPSALIPHGHYRDWFAAFPHPEAVSGRFGYAGLIRRYKGVEELLAAFGGTTDPALTLTVAGKPSSTDLREAVESLAAADGRIEPILHFLDDAELVEILSSSQLVVLPYLFMHNSGGVLAALSVDRPVLVPDNEVNRLLAAEVGEEWVIPFTPPLSAAHLEDGIARAAAIAPDSTPDLRARDWDGVGSAHLAAFRAAVVARKG